MLRRKQNLPEWPAGGRYLRACVLALDCELELLGERLIGGMVAQEPASHAKPASILVCN
jgi:hypothetical protein